MEKNVLRHWIVNRHGRLGVDNTQRPATLLFDQRLFDNYLTVVVPSFTFL